MPVAVREAALIYAESMGMPQLLGTLSDIADQFEHFANVWGADGLVLVITYTSGCLDEFVDLVVLQLQRRGRACSNNSHPRCAGIYWRSEKVPARHPSGYPPNGREITES